MLRFRSHYEEQHGPLQLPVLVGVLPLYGTRHAEFLNNEIPGISIPDHVREHLRRAGENGSREGVKMARDLLAELHDLAQGVYLMPAFNRFDLIAEVIEVIGLAPLGDRPASPWDRPASPWEGPASRWKAVSRD